MQSVSMGLLDPSEGHLRQYDRKDTLPTAGESKDRPSANVGARFDLREHVTTKSRVSKIATLHLLKTRCAKKDSAVHFAL